MILDKSMDHGLGSDRKRGEGHQSSLLVVICLILKVN